MAEPSANAGVLAARAGSGTLAAQLEAVLAEVGGVGPVSDLRRLSGGASRETWSFAALLDGEPVRLVVQREPVGEGRSRSLVREARVLRAAAAQGVPVAPVVAADDGPALESPFLITRHVPGEAVARRILTRAEYAPARSGLAFDCGRALARIHSLDPATVSDLDARNPLAELRAELDAVREPHPVFELALRWLIDNPTPAVPPRVVHGDFRLGNLIVGTGGLLAVLDWEHAHLGDPMEDLGWMCIKSWRFGGEAPVGGFGTAEDLLSGYAEVAGFSPAHEVLRWWQIAGTLRWGIACVGQYHRAQGANDRALELALIGRRACECEHDLLRLLP